jgi:predicted ATPase/DNA-binding CsgD family transcriptional regulator
LPVHVSSFIGREAELAEVHALVGASRLVTLTGTGGAGKSRLGLQVATAVLAEGTGDGAWFADLAPLSDPDLVAVTVAGALGVQVEPGRPAGEALAEAVGERRLLLLLDNCEHVIGACAKLADMLLRGCPGLTVLATSREPLGIDGERVYRVPSLGVPADDADAAAVRASEAVRLLTDRAAAQGVPLSWDENSAAVAGRICRRLDGIPLAIELAAARLRVMPASELEARLDERFALLTGGSRAGLPRQRTLRATVDWSWELLAASERAVLARLSVFAGGFGLAAAEAAATGPDVPRAEVTGVLGALVDKSLVQFDRAGTGLSRYRLLDTVRQYAAAKLDEYGPAAAGAVRAAHRDYYLALAEEAASHLEADGHTVWLDRLDTELDNLRAALTFTMTQPDPGPGVRLAVALRDYWNIRGHAAEGVSALRALLDAPAIKQATLPRARALAAASLLLLRTGDYAIATDYAQEASAIARAVGDEYLEADLTHVQARVLLRQSQPGAALPLIERGLELARRLGESHLTAMLLIDRAYAMNVEEDHAGAARDTSEALEFVRRAGDPNEIQVGQLLGNLGYYEMSAGELDSARRHLAEALTIARTVNDRSNLIHQTFNLGLAEYLGGSLETARALLTEGLDVALRTGTRPGIAYALLGLALAGPGALTGRGETGHAWSARLHGAADQALADLGHAPEALEARLGDADRQRLRAAMGASAFEAEYAAGRTLDPAQVLASLERTSPVTGQQQDAAVLTPRELDVLRLVAQGLSNSDIARRLVISDHTVHRHLANILHKLGLSSRAAAAAWAVRAGLI